MGFKPAVSLTEQIADHLSGEIIAGRLAPTERIQELRVARDLGVSRGSVREALLILEGRHLIDIIPRRGAIVSALEPEQVEGLLELSADLLTLLFQSVAQRSSGTENGLLDGLDGAAQAMTEWLGEGQQVELVNAKFDFVKAAFPLSDNAYLASVLDDLLPAVHRVTHRASEHPSFDPRDTVRLANGLLDAIREQQIERIGELVHGHFRRELRLASDVAVH